MDTDLGTSPRPRFLSGSWVKAAFARARPREWISIPTLYLWIEIALIIGWAFLAGRLVLNFDPNMWPNGFEFPLSVRENFFWTNLLRCGACAFWNGSINGGYPALVDLQSAPFHPLVAIPTLLFGVINGAKVTLVLSMALAGVAQWWLGRLLGLGRVARVWAALIAVAAGSVTGKMENGLVVLVLSTASCMLVIPAGVNLAQKPSLRSSVLLAAALGMAVLSGQGYLQIGLALSIVPALFILFLGDAQNTGRILKGFGLAVVVAALLAGALLVPWLHQSGNFVKDTDATFGTIQPLEYLPLNLVIRDTGFFYNDSLHKLSYPYLYVNYIGWVPVLLAALALRLIPRQRLRVLIFFLTAIALVYLNSTMILPRLLFGVIAEDLLIGIRHPTLMAGLAVPLVLGLAGWGLDLALQAGPNVSIQWGAGESKHIRLSWLLLAVPLVWGVLSVYQFAQAWLFPAAQPGEIEPVMNAMRPGSAGWVQFPFSELSWFLEAQEQDFKVAEAFHPWHLLNRQSPPAALKAERSPAEQPLAEVFADVQGLTLSKDPQVHYAAVQMENGAESPCSASARGGQIALVCQNDAPGMLVVYEHAWAGWRARVDGARAQLEPGEWLALKLPAGRHRVNLNYLPWDAPLGALLSLVGIGAAVYLWRKKE